MALAKGSFEWNAPLHKTGLCLQARIDRGLVKQLTNQSSADTVNGRLTAVVVVKKMQRRGKNAGHKASESS